MRRLCLLVEMLDPHFCFVTREITLELTDDQIAALAPARTAMWEIDGVVHMRFEELGAVRFYKKESARC